MPFTKGHTLSRGKRIRRKVNKHTLKTILDYIEQVKENELPAIIDAMIVKAKAGDKELMMYLTDRCLGRPRQEIDSRVKAQIIVTPDDYRTAVQEIIAEEQALIAEYSEINPSE